PINEILASRIVVGGIRIAILFAIAYVIVSMIALTVRRQWLTGIGPLRVSEAARGVEAERDYLAQQLTFAGQEIESLQAQLGDSLEALEQSQADLHEVLDLLPNVTQTEDE